jgi:regulator of protease activity HflC (stomatin/prohibitin superfamily)
MIDTAMIAAPAGFLGGVVGALVTAHLTTQRERWNLRRELYTRLLENLGEVVDALELLHDALRAGPGPTEKAKDQWDIRIGRLTERESRAEEEIRRATSVAAIMLTNEALKALKSFRKEWKLSEQAESSDEHISIRLEGARKANDLLVNAAKKDLGF